MLAVVIYALMLLGVLVTPVLLGPLGHVAGLPFRLGLRLEERLARAALARDRARTTLTVGTLVVGLAMVVALGVVGANARVAATAWLADVVPGDEILTAIAPAPVGDGGVDEQLAAIPGVTLATPLATFDLAFEGTRLEATAIRGTDFAADGRLTFAAGDRAAALEALDEGGAVILPQGTGAAPGPRPRRRARRRRGRWARRADGRGHRGALVPRPHRRGRAGRLARCRGRVRRRRSGRVRGPLRARTHDRPRRPPWRSSPRPTP